MTVILEPGESEVYTILFFIPSFILLFIFGFILVNKLLLKEINKGYFSTWLTTPMSRQTTLNSKFFVILSSILILNISVLLTQLILFSSIYENFNSQMTLEISLYFLSLIFVSFLFSSITWIISCYFCNNQSLSISLISGILVIFVLFYILSDFISSISQNLENLKYFKYLTIVSFLKKLSFSSSRSLLSNQIQNFNSISLVWQIPVELILTSGLFIFGNWLFCRKDLHL
ncbi:hypothetical protein [Spiroplasma endosymbiont of Lariophagus distinguendus]|uniref:hypothetical protein n=1 Tax=Spiroplasma endosymbiont of Lariophagus distinguendus TaxID=2935082 RepID=UPI0020794927|nr:hypothetical protein [Spiroplasma endosymbiont of Lariophagus distinguendus]